MKIQCVYDKLVPIGELELNPNNRNLHPPEQIKRLAQILEYQGWRYCVKVSNQTGFVTSGHGRIEAARLNGWTEIPVDYQDYDSADQEYADEIADNAIASWAELDLSGINMDIGDLGPFNVELLGIQSFEIEPADKTPEKVDLNQQWIVSIHCSGEHDMRKIYDEMMARGHECKLIT